MIRLQCIGWGDLLTSYNGVAITYDEIGNPLSYYNGENYTFTWNGRRLVSELNMQKRDGGSLMRAAF